MKANLINVLGRVTGKNIKKFDEIESAMASMKNLIISACQDNLKQKENFSEYDILDFLCRIEEKYAIYFIDYLKDDGIINLAIYNAMLDRYNSFFIYGNADDEFFMIRAYNDVKSKDHESKCEKSELLNLLFTIAELSQKSLELEERFSKHIIKTDSVKVMIFKDWML